MVFVTKADGTRQLFDREKVVRTCLNMGETREAADAVAKSIETRVHDGVETKKILQLIFRLLNEYRPSAKHHIDLRRALGLLRSRPDFEVFVQVLLSEHGYAVTPNQIIRGRCVEHEVDAIARRDGRTYIVEVKQHSDYHKPTGLDEARIARAVLEDVTEGFEDGLNNLKADNAMIVCNTRLSEHAKAYLRCRGIHHIGWNSPPEYDLQTMIRERSVLPITYLKDLGSATRDRLAAVGIVVLKQLINRSPEELSRATGIRKADAEEMIQRARAVLTGTA